MSMPIVTSGPVSLLDRMMDNPYSEYILMEYLALIMLPIVVVIRLCVLEVLFQKWKKRIISLRDHRKKDVERLLKVEAWIRLLATVEGYGKYFERDKDGD